ncbi:MAG: hypothetical protein ABI791_14960 [Acidobacteriota bacterium]
MSRTDNENTPAALPITSEEIGFKPDEMTACAACGRANPPNRLNCFYCAVTFDAETVDRSRVKLAQTRLESWERGLNMVAVSATGEISDDAAADVARNIGGEWDLIRAAVDGNLPLPLVRIESEAEAEIIAANLLRIGILTTMVPDTAFAADNLPIRCRSIDLCETTITLTPFNAGPPAQLNLEEIRLIVSGTLCESKVEATENRKSRKSTVEIESESTAEYFVIDIYHSDDHFGYRLSTKGFDFSCLGNDMGYVAAANMQELLERIVKSAPEAKFVSNYNYLRRMLGSVWEVDERNDSLGIKRSGFGKTTIANVRTSSNLSQFTKYSRLHRQLL